MIDHCVRCHAERKRGLSGLGEIYALQRPGYPTTHHWLCEKCVRKYTLRLDLGSELVVAARTTARDLRPVIPQADLRLVFQVMASPEPGSASRMYLCEWMDESTRGAFAASDSDHVARMAG